jgi:hypothetical protein
MATSRKTIARAVVAEGRVSLRELNRAALARQMLLARAPVSIGAAVARLVGLQAQLPGAPYVGLWTRVADLSRAEVAAAVTARALVRATSMRGTLHLMTADDFLQFRSVLQPVLSRGFGALPAERTRGIDIDALTADGRRCLADGPRTFEQVRAYLDARHPGLDVRAMGHAVRMHLPIVQVPGKGTWGFAPEPDFALAEAWLGRAPAVSTDPRALVLRYLAAFGPAAARDAQSWSGLQKLGDTFEALRPELRVLTGEDGRELFDLPDAPRPPGDAPAPPRFLPEFDNLVVGDSGRARVVPEAYRPLIYLSALRVRATFLIDGMVQGAWKIERTKKLATLVVEPFAALAKADRAALAEEGEKLVRFVEEGAQDWAVRFEKP